MAALRGHRDGRCLTVAAGCRLERLDKPEKSRHGV